MICDACGEREAAVAYTEFADGKASTWHLCEDCAAKRGVSASLSSLSGPLVNVLMGLIGEIGRVGAPEEGPVCPACGCSLAEFRRSGKLGCARCYESFRDELRPLLRRIHGSCEHGGRVPSSLEPTEGPRREIRELRSDLDRAVKREEYERAAKLRDLIREKETALGGRKGDGDVRRDDA